MINITFYFYRFLDSLCSLEMTVLHLAWISRLASLARNDSAASRLGFSTRFARSK